MALARLLVVAILAAAAPRAAAFAVAGNDALCNGTAAECPCGSEPPAWPLLSAASWCPAGCQNAEGTPDETGDMAVDVRGVCAAFAKWSEPSTEDALRVAGCPLTAAPRVSLLYFRPCFNLTALLSGESNITCTPCALPPDPPSPPPPAPPATPPSPPPDAPQGAVQLVETTLCLAGVAEDVNLTAVGGAIAALLGVNAADVALALTGALIGGCVSSPSPPARRLLQLPASAPPAPPLTPTAVLVAVTTRAGESTSAADAAVALQQLGGAPSSSPTAASLLLVDAMQRLGEPRVSAVRLSSSGGGVTITAAPSPPSAPPPAAPALAPAALKTGEQLLPLRIVIAAIVGVAFCCIAPCILLSSAAWNAAAHVVILVGVRGCWDGCAMVDVALAETKDAAPQTALDCAAASLESACAAFFGARMDSTRVRSLDVRSLQPAEAALHAPLLWRARGRGGKASASAGSAPVDGDEVEAAFAVTAVFRSPAVAWQWRAAADACAGGRALTTELVTALAAAAPSVAKLRASLALLRPAPREGERGGAARRSGGGEPAEAAPAAPLKRRATLYVTSHPLRK